MPDRATGQPVAFISVSVQTWFSSEDMVAAPGERLTLPLSIHNLGESTESYTIIPAGLSASWTTIARGNVTLFGGSQDVVEVVVLPPAIPTTSAGPSVINVRVIPQGEPDDAVVAEIVLAIQPFDDRRIITLQPVQRARHRANYEFMVENHGNALASCRLRLVDPTNRVDGSFDPPAVGVAPGSASLVRFKAKAKRGVFRHATRTLDFEVEAEQQGHDPANGSMSIVQSPTVPGSAIVRVLTVAAVAAAAAASWYGVVRPELRETVDQRVDARIAELAPVIDPGGLTPVATTASDDGTEPIISASSEQSGEPAFIRLAVDAGLTATDDASSTIPDGEIFDLTDMRVENSLNESGIATLMINGEAAYQWSLSNIRGQLFEPSITPIRLQPGDNITFSVRCDAVGAESTKSKCTTAINIGGLIRPASDI
ncbi:MAG: hypothetical protein ACI8RE_000794 [Ilumatobacter sp.]|jgi:hypothetical protein